MTASDLDIVLLGDFRLFGGTTTSAADEVRTLHTAGYRIGLVQVNSHITGRMRPPLPEIQRLLEEGHATLLGPEDRVHARLLVVHNARILEQPAQLFPEIVAERKAIVVHRAPLDGRGGVIFDCHAVHAIATSLFGDGFCWLPISPVCRDNMLRTGFDLPLGDEDWTNIVFAADWAGVAGNGERRVPRSDRPIIGRHSRPELEKYPDTRSQVLTVYPADPGLDIRMLGVDHRLVDLLGGRLPDNWTTWSFNQITPQELLRQIDHYVYFHHSEWFETFGRNIAEAISSGAVVYLPHYLEPTFGEAALYADPDEVVEKVRRLHADRRGFARQSRQGRQLIAERYGPRSFTRMIERLIGPPSRGARPSAGGGRTQPEPTPPAVDEAPVAAAALHGPHFLEADIVVVANFCSRGETAWRIASETRIQADARLKTVFVHVPCEGVPAFKSVNPMIDACVRGGLAAPVDPQRTLVKARLVIVHDADALLARLPARSPRILADQTVVVLDRSPFDPATAFDHVARHALAQSLFGEPVVWAATTETLRRALLDDGRVPVADLVWHPSVHAGGCHPHDDLARPVPTVGMLVADETDATGITGRLAATLLPPPGEAVVKLLHCGEARLGTEHERADWQILHESEISPLKFLNSLDVLVHFTAAATTPLPAHALAWAMLRGKLVLTDRRHRPQFGDAATYVEPASAAGVTRLYWEDQDALSMQRRAVVAHARRLFGEHIHLGRLQRLMTPARPLGVRPVQRRIGNRQRVLFMTSNGTGLGHVTRLLAVARRLDQARIEPIFVSLSQAIGPIQRAGYAVEYVPSPIYADVDGRLWNDWFALRMQQVVEQYRPDAVVFDGSSTYEGLNQAIAPDPDIKLIWIRRGMWRRDQDNAEIIERQKFYDLIIEPADIADARDSGETARWKHFVVPVEPIRMFDKDELLSRVNACAQLGLDPSRRACLIQLGSGANRDIVSMIDDTLAACAKHPALQVVVAEWLIANRQIDLWPGIKRLRGYPMSPYFAAFDFTVSAAGYNSFNEIVSFGLPAVFIANQEPTMDDQDGRSRFAEDMGAAFHVDETETPQIGAYIDAIMDERVRDMLRMNMARIARGNGAATAAELITRAIAR
jgi:UDP:flavonoid glycosyltransferase YjiC (YdhE family)